MLTIMQDIPASVRQGCQQLQQAAGAHTRHPCQTEAAVALVLLGSMLVPA